MTKIRDGALILAAGVTVVGTVVWIKKAMEFEETNEALKSQQTQLSSSLERLGAAIERIDGQVQELHISLEALRSSEPQPPRRLAAAGQSASENGRKSDAVKATKRTRKSSSGRTRRKSGGETGTSDTGPAEEGTGDSV